ncbi:DUF2510 domain-containing protein [Microbacterium sp. A84]|uniref:DUF2510 domain-containing protein n=1 Tax=Microbacterium sp. A84 TaxID=3450715 RepID=UPI003F42F0AA
MGAQPGWYDAGIPGRERWWDGLQWTAHEREVAARLPPTGWYSVGDTSDVRWWDGAGWTPYRIRAGRPRPDALAIEPSKTGIMLGVLFIALGLMQFGLYSVSSSSNSAFLPVLTLAAGAIWLIGGVHTSQLRKLPVPQTAAVFDPSARPLPGEVEGVGAGWYPVAGQVTRWWTGTRWSWYIGQKFGVRPGHAGPRGYLISVIAGGVLAGFGVLGVLLGITLIGALGAIWGVAIIIFGVFMVLMGGLILLLTRFRRFAMILPPGPPPLR